MMQVSKPRMPKISFPKTVLSRRPYESRSDWWDRMWVYSLATAGVLILNGLALMFTMTPYPLLLILAVVFGGMALYVDGMLIAKALDKWEARRRAKQCELDEVERRRQWNEEAEGRASKVNKGYAAGGYRR